MPKVIGIDLAGLEKNDTGVCALTFSEDPNIHKVAKVKLLKKDSEILTFIDEENPQLIAIDAPLSVPINGIRRKCDEMLNEYGVLPPLMGGMRYLTQRGMDLSNIIRQSYTVIEVNSKISAKLLGYYNTDNETEQKELLNMGIKGDTEKRVMKPDEIEAISAAITAYLYTIGKAVSMSGPDGSVIIPKV